MTTAKHQEEARERVWLLGRVAFNHPRNGGVEYFPASLLSSRDREIREVLEGLCTGDQCWCEPQRTGPHSPACLATRALYDKLNSTTDTSGALGSSPTT